MSRYLVCQKKRNFPRIDIRVCQAKCPEKDTCTEFQKNKHVLSTKEKTIDH